MMKKINLLAVLMGALMMVGCAGKCHISGVLITDEADLRFDSVICEVAGERCAVAVTDSAFEMELQCKSPEFVSLVATCVDANGCLVDDVTLPIVTESGSVEVSYNYTSEEYKLQGTQQNDAIYALFTTISSEMEGFEKEPDYELIHSQLTEFVTTYAQKPAAVYGLRFAANFADWSEVIFPWSEWKELYDGCSDYVKQHPKVAPSAERYAQKQITAVGQPFVDFEIATEDSVIKLSDYVGKGNLVLVDFWASWCGPCRQAIPNVKEVYEAFADKGLVVVGVPTSDKPEDTRLAMEQEGITFAQMIGVEAQAVGAKAYGVNGIPHMILFAPDGTILARGLRGDELYEAVAEQLQ